MFNQQFYNESLRKTVIAFGSLFNNISISRKDSSSSKIQTMKVPLAYGPKEKFIARLEKDLNITQKTAITLPRIGFEIDGLEYDSTRKLNRIIKRKKVSEDTNKKLKEMTTQYTPVPYDLSFSLFIMSKNSDDAIQIVEQIVPYFQPEHTVTIKEVPEMDIIRDVPIILNSISYEDNYEGDFQTRRAIIYTFDFTAKCYVYGPVTTSKPITKAEVNTYDDLLDQAPTRVQKYTVTADSIDNDDNFGFSESVSEWVS